MSYPPPGYFPPSQPPAQPLVMPKKPTGLITTIIVLAVLLVASVIALVVFVPRALNQNQTTQTTDTHGCPPGYYWGYGGNPQGMTPEEIEAASSCLQEGMTAKPVIYLYPSQTTDVSVRLSHPENLTVSYPDYGDGWAVTAQPNGDLTDLASGRSLYALYYESRDLVPAVRETDGFVVPGDQTAPFLEDKLAQLGLTPRESEEFIVYWLPIMQDNPWNYIRFRTAAEIDANQTLSVSPAPDTLIRIVMSYEPLTEPVDVVPQVLPPTPQRTGFAVVEWGGTRITQP